MKNIYIVLLALSFFFSLAHAEESAPYSISCGEGRDKGYKNAEVALLDDPDSSIRLYLDGKALPEERVSMGSKDDGWILSLEGKKGKSDRQYTFSEPTKDVQEYIVDKKGELKEVGKPLPCIFPAN